MKLGYLEAAFPSDFEILCPDTNQMFFTLRKLTLGRKVVFTQHKVLGLASLSFHCTHKATRKAKNRIPFSAKIRKSYIMLVDQALLSIVRVSRGGTLWEMYRLGKKLAKSQGLREANFKIDPNSRQCKDIL